MTIKNDCWVSINLNDLVKDRMEFLNIELSEDEIQETASELRTRMTFDSLFEQTDYMVWEIADATEHLPKYGDYEPKKFDLVKLSSPTGSWEIEVPVMRKVL